MYQPAGSPIGKVLVSSADFGVLPISCAEPLRRPAGGWQALAKRTMDIVLALLLIAVLSVPMFLVAIVIRLESPGPTLFPQRRIGRDNVGFIMWKFRTMYHHPPEEGRLDQVTKHDKRITQIGALLRRTSIDEVPQLFNILRGDMSFVGPRPHAPGTRAGGKPFELVTPHYRARHRVKPGLTGLAQIRGWRGETETEEKLLRRVESDLEYIDNWSLWLDLRILCQTAAPVLAMQNAY